jgi:hypothetical protein
MEGEVSREAFHAKQRKRKAAEINFMQRRKALPAAGYAKTQKILKTELRLCDFLCAFA